MESLPIANLDDLLSTIEPKPLTRVGIKHYRLPDIPANTYRIYFTDGSYKELQAENASHAYQLCERTDAVKIVNMRCAYSNILKRDVLHPTGAEIAVETQPNATSQAVVTVNDMAEYHKPASFEMFNFQDLGRLQKQYKKLD